MELKHLLSEFDKQVLEDMKTLAKSLEDAKVEDEEPKDIAEEKEVKPEPEVEAKAEVEEPTEEPKAEEEEEATEEAKAEEEATEEVKSEDAEVEVEEAVSKSIDKEEEEKEKEPKKDDKDADEDESDSEDEEDKEEDKKDKKDDKEDAKKSTEVVDEFSRKSIEEISDVVKGLAAIVGSVLKAVQATANTSTEARKSVDDLKLQLSDKKEVEEADLDVVEKSVTMPISTKELASDVVAKSDEDQEETVTVAEPTVEVEAEVTEDTTKPEENAEQEVVKTPKEVEDKKDVFAENRDAFMTKFKKASQDGSVSRGTLQELRTIYGAVQQGHATEKEIARFVEFSK